jgi:Tubulin like
MTRYAPTLLVGLGGSGVKVLRWIGSRQVRGGRTSDRDLLVYRGIDFDADANSGSRAMRLADGEFFHFDAASIADCVGNLSAEIRGRAGQPPRRPFREIAEWYPDPEGRFIRYAQAEAVGARQWRPLGRIGFFLNDVEIMQPLREGLVELDARCGVVGELRPASICIVTSVAGGTGSGILLDVAANLRKYRPEIGIRLVLLLPEFFEHMDFTSKVLANAYAVLTEVAHYKNQDRRFTARYPRLPDIDVRLQTSLFQRVYLVGPYVGDRRPFVEPDDAFAHVAELLHVFLSKELRANAGSYQVNDDADQNADTAAVIGDRASRQVFCGFSATAIPLLTYDDLATRWAATFVAQWQASPDRNDIFATLQPPPTPETIRRLEDYIDASAAASEAVKYLQPEDFSRILSEFIRTYVPEEKEWTRESLRTFTRRLSALTGAGATDTPEFLLGPVDTFRTAFRAKVTELVRRHELTPFAVMAELRAIAQRLRRQSEAARSIAYRELDEFNEWLGGKMDGFLAQPLLPQRIQRLEEWLREWQKEHGRDAGVAWFAYGIRSGAASELEAVIAKEEESWAGGAEFVAALAGATDDAFASNERKRERFDVDSRRTRSPEEILRREMERIDRKPERMQDLSRAMLASIRHRIAAANRTRDYHAAAQGLLADLKDLFIRELQPGGRTTGGAVDRFRYLSPESTYEEDLIRRAVLSAGTRLFRPGRVDNDIRKRTGRLIVPQSFAGSDAVTQRLKHLCNGLLGAAMREVSVEGMEENRILILVEDLFHSAEELSGIYDYYNDYRRQRRELFHIRADIPSTFDELVTTLDLPGPLACGNAGCRYDVRGTPRTEIFCPGCGNPIRNRCGNSCRLDDLTERPDREAIIERGRCPACERPLRTYWWSCPRHGRMPIEAVQCSACIADGRPKPERRSEVPDVFVCPGCIGRGNPHPFRATGFLARILLGHARGEDRTTVERIVSRTFVHGSACPVCGVELVPQCPGAGPSHVLGRAKGEWGCDAHPARYFECGACGFPLQEHESFCRRCESALSECRFCTSACHVRVVASADGVCPRCRLSRTTLFFCGRLQDEDPAALFCSNIYGCAVGADLCTVTYPAGTRACAICEAPGLSLLEVRTRGMHIDACPFCRVLFERYAGRRPGPACALPAGVCCLCGQMFATSKSLAAAPQSFEVALQIGIALLRTRDDAEAFGRIFDTIPPSEQQRLPSHIHDYACRVQRHAVRTVVHPRLARLLDGHQRQFGCQQFGAPGPAPCPPPLTDSSAAVEDGADEDTVESALSSERVSRLQTNDDYERWVSSVVRLGIDYDRFDAALGGSSQEPEGGPKDQRLQELRDSARALYRKLMSPK